MIKLQGKYEFEVVGDGETSEMQVNLANLSTPHEFVSGLMPTGVSEIKGKNISGSQAEFPIQGTLESNKLTLKFQGAPAAGVRVTARLFFGPADN